MDLTGLAAILALPAAFIVAVAGVARERTLFKRWERTEKMLAEGSLHSDQKQMIENARDHLAERIAVLELQPRMYELLAGALILGAFGLFLVLALFSDQDANPWGNRGFFEGLGWVLYWLACIAITARSIARAHWVGKNRPRNYRRPNYFF
ncbi:hypothetical protein LQK89_02670 [Curtobacterium sp. C1]|uniref:hypothetical protein n=1 Tax=Curtobacterium sp. C1 TaxID=2898151 RepID=UPI001E401B5B|nr:hypothetical protein [Curtobacterium sp. C1]UFU14622.1 hypothetical protein LQK89_02670 [Curtobacterium sp. C1]